MGESSHQSILRILSGEDRSLVARLTRAATAVVEPFYAGMMSARNLGYTRGILTSTRLPHPTISVGNITTGGTGKTPVVRWLANRLREGGRRPAVLLRGYRSDASGHSDEQQLLERGLNWANVPVIPVIANPDRVAGASRAVSVCADVDTFVLDDGFQHRRVRRDFDLVLISATDPFGFKHVLPRGLLRESLVGLRRADAVLITRWSQADDATRRAIESEITRLDSQMPIFHADHLQAGIWAPAGDQREPIESLRDQRVFVVCGIASPAAFAGQIKSLGAQVIGERFFADHHSYSLGDLEAIRAQASAAGVKRIITTEKDWVKIAALKDLQRSQVPISVVEMNIGFVAGDEERLFERIWNVIKEPRTK
jgi:tetraacyldisaccharide 4'-kinase